MAETWFLIRLPIQRVTHQAEYKRINFNIIKIECMYYIKTYYTMNTSYL